MSNPSQRLHSISRPSSTGPSSSGSTKPGLKFKPKVVARKTKEERDANSPITKPGVNRKPTGTRGGIRGGRGGARGGAKIPRHLQNTTLVASGPLSSGAVSLGSTVGTHRSHSGMSGGSSGGASAAFLEKLRSKTPEAKLREDNFNFSDEEDFVDDGNSARINMSQAYSWDEADTELFPVRADRTQHYEFGEEPVPDTSIKTEFHREISAPPLSDSEPPTRETSVKAEENANFSLIPDATASDDLVDAVTEYQNMQESKRLAEDYESILSFMKDCKVVKEQPKEKIDEESFPDADEETKELSPPTETNPEPKFLFVQLPEQLPTFVSKDSPVQPEVKEEQVNVSVSKYSTTTNKNTIPPSGMIGKLRYHKSGKITMKVGNIVLDVTRGGASKFMQDIVSINDETNECYYLGDVNEKIIATPSFI